MSATAPRADRRVIAIDGPAASGKSTTARAVAARLGFVHLNSGLLYRAITWRAMEDGWPPGPDGLEDLLAGVRIDLVPDGTSLDVRIDGEEPGAALFGPAVSDRVSGIAAASPVRAFVLERLRAAGQQFDLVCDGRDIGSTVFPGADVKVFLVAAAGERARRRLLDLGLETTPAVVSREADRLSLRDAADSGRELSPLRRTPDAIAIDTTNLSVDEVVDAILRYARAAGIECRTS